MSPTQTTAELGGRTIARVGLGTNRLEDTPANHDFLHAAAAAGVGHIDTAHLYRNGDSERTIGAAFDGDSERPVVATKAGYNSNEPDKLRAEIEQSFESLRTDVIDLLYLHRAKDDAPFAQTIALLDEFRQAGRVRELGLSEVTIGEISQARDIAPIAAVQNEYSLGERKHEEVIDFCALEGIAFVPFFPLRGDHPRLAEIAQGHDATPNQVKIAWLLARSPCVVPIPGTLSIEHLRENLAATELELSPDELEALNEG